jgi:galactose-6-phosphate isomerase
MPLLDVTTDIFSDPYLIDTFLVTRSTQSVDSHGEASDLQTIIPMVYGVVAPADNSVIAKFPEGEVQHGDIVIYTTFALTDGRGKADFDVVTWHGNTYQVKSTNDWSAFGPGYIEAVCTLNVVSQ